RDLAAEVHPEVLRFLLVSQHYRTPINFSRDAVHLSEQSMVRFYEMFDRVNRTARQGAESRIKDLAEKFLINFDNSLCDDFNTAKAIAELHDLTTEVNRALDVSPLLSPDDISALTSVRNLVSQVLGILEDEPSEFLERIKRAGIGTSGLGEKDIMDLIAERNAARKARDFKKADEIRDMLHAKGIQLKDTPEGTLWEKA
ncbi:cysteine--tRNA ligase, partial [bacterium]|nr:cysteine--tRNA ligase [bacterium]